VTNANFVASRGGQSHRFSKRRHDRAAPKPITKLNSVSEWARIVIAALGVVGGMVAFEILVLWIVAERLIERIPF
jgi:hypothetical protein